MMFLLGALAGAQLAGCDTAEPVLDPGGGNAELGIAKFHVVETETALEVVGLSGAGAEVAALRVRHGHVEEELSAGLGRVVEVNAVGEELHYQNVGLEPLRLVPPPTKPSIEALVFDPYVAQVLRRWDIAFVHHERGEPSPAVDYGHGGSCGAGWSVWASVCGGQQLPNNKCCAEQQEAVWNYTPQKVVCDNNSKTAERACLPPPNCGGNGTYPACTAPLQTPANCPYGSHSYFDASTQKYLCRIDNGTGCSLKSLGDNGCAVCVGPTAISAPAIMTTSYAPEPTDTCSFVTNYELELTTSRTGAATGSVGSSPNVVAATQTGSPTSTSAVMTSGTQVVLTATPSSSARVVMSGSCNVTGTPGQVKQCTVTMSSARSVHVTFEEVHYSLGVTTSSTNLAYGAVVSTPDDLGEVVESGSGNSGSADFLANSVVTLTAIVNEPNAKATLTGACSASGSYGQQVSCNVTMSSAKNVAVAFSCKKAGQCQGLQ